MKKFVAILLTAITCIWFAGCGIFKVFVPPSLGSDSVASESHEGRPSDGSDTSDSSGEVLTPPLPNSSECTYYGIVQTIEENPGLYVNIDRVGICQIPAYEKEKLTLKEGDLLVMEFYSGVEIMEMYPATFSKPADYMAVIDVSVLDFSFSFTWGVFGDYSYDSTTGNLTKRYTMPDYKPGAVTCNLTMQEKVQIYKIIQELDMDSYPDEYNPTEGIASVPNKKLVLSAQLDRITKTITAREVAFSDATSEKGQKFMDACDAIEDILENTEEWKALPDYPYLYE